MALPIPIIPPVNLPGAADAAVPDKKVKLSELVKGYGWDERVAVAIILAESRGRVNATNHNTDGSTDDGLFQINSVHGFDRQKLRSDPVYNTKAAYKVYSDAGGWSPWVTYQTGAYKPFLGKDATITMDRRTLANPLDAVNAVGDAAGAVGDGLDIIGEVVGALANPSTWMRLGKGALGGVLIIVGVGGITLIIANRIPAPIPPVKAVKAVKALT